MNKKQQDKVSCETLLVSQETLGKLSNRSFFPINLNLDQKENSKNEIKINSHYIPLSPTDRANKCDVYLEALEWALNNKDIKNIAISGPYGSGKSSIIKTFEENHKKRWYNFWRWSKNRYTFLNISLATFREEKNDRKEQKETGPRESKEDLLRLIELSIIQQLFFHEKESVLSDSRLKKIRKHSRLKNFGYAILSTLFILSVSILFFPDFIKKIDFVKYLLDKPICNMYASVIFISVCMLIIYKLYHLVNRISIKRLNFNNAEIEIDSNVSKSILNNHIDEILYFFEATKYNVVVIEDLDRFEQAEVFTKLREINLLINNSKKIKRDIVFIYAIKDDMFLDKDRVKFFEFIIPIVPVINFSNSESILQKIVEQNNYPLKTELIDDLAFFIDDMRLLYNIMNEYYIYNKKITEDSNLEQNQLLSLVVYKNIYPNDFVKLSENDGILYKIISSKYKLIQNEIKKADEEIDILKKELSEIQFQNIRDIRELRTIYLAKIIDCMPSMDWIAFNIDNKPLSISEATEEEYFKKITQGNISYHAYIPHGNYFIKNIKPYSFKFSDIENKVDPNFDYLKREELLAIHKLNEVKQKIQNLNDKKKNIQKYTVKKLLIDNKLPSFKEDGSNSRQYELIYLLLRNGYIDENYLDYISIFHEGSLTKEDYQFFINVKLDKNTPFDYNLVKTEELLKKVEGSKFGSACILNFCLVDEILKTEQFREKRNSLFLLLSNESNSSITFIDEYITRSTEIEEFVKELSNHWKNIWNYLFENSYYPTEKMEKYFLYIIEYADDSDIIDIFSDNTSFLNGYSDFLKIDINKDKMVNIITGLNLKFNNLSADSPEDMIRFIFNKNYYDFKIIKSILQKLNLYNATFETANFHFISNMKDKVFLQYIQDNIEEYIKRLYLNLKDNTGEYLDSYLQLLNNKNINNTLKEQIIAKVKTFVSDVSSIEDSAVQELLFKHSKVEPKWENILFCFEKENTVSPALLQYLNVKENAMQLSKIKMTTEEIDGKHIYSKLSWEIIHCMNINLDPYKLLAKSIPWWYDSFEKEKLDNERILILIENMAVSPVSDSYNYLKENFPDSHIKLIEKHLDKMLKLKNDLIIDDHDLYLIFHSIKIPVEKKCLFVDVCTDEVILKSTENIKALMEMKEIFNQEIKRQSLKISLMNNQILSANERIWLFDNNADLMDTSLIDNFLKSLGTYYGEIVDKSKKVLLPDNPINRTLLTSLQKLGYISSFTEKGDTLRVNHRRSR